ncbi:MAG TPA: DEAD/DEAH box helicase [Chitinophagaceae bacterium]|nr:DEAD/DEAH box helicase [Chitinophagaceae bacterium]MCB9054702.1 DEAD/DEAH box helicase [Chitinophagales bacterium]HRX92608.1 DEAD/DEAH box helicase [Chitinophagaceae bacterium]
MQFKEFDFHPALLEGIEASNYETATPIQEKVIPPIMAGKDVIASAQTGTGKTAAFLLPIMNRLLQNHSENTVGALIVVPTRELAIQISQHIEGLSYFTHLSSIAIYGGSGGDNFIAEKKALQMGADIIVCTPGRMIAHMNMGYVNMKGLQFLVLDEADRMLDMGFVNDILRIIKPLPANRQNLLFSATMPEKIRQLARQTLKDPVEINIAISKPPEKVTQKAFIVYEAQKNGLLKLLLKQSVYKNALVFCSKKQTVKQIRKELKQEGFTVEEIHSDLEQAQREDVLRAFTSGRVPLLVATDILSRGIDIDTIDLVLNYDVPADGEDYVHRIGRTARAEADGSAFTLVGEKEQNRFASIELLIGKEVEKAEVPKEFGETPSYKPKLRSVNHNKNPKRKFYRGTPKRR